jgi:hypothetical protein
MRQPAKRKPRECCCSATERPLNCATIKPPAKSRGLFFAFVQINPMHTSITQALSLPHHHYALPDAERGVRRAEVSCRGRSGSATLRLCCGCITQALRFVGFFQLSNATHRFMIQFRAPTHYPTASVIAGNIIELLAKETLISLWLVFYRDSCQCECDNPGDTHEA